MSDNFFDRCRMIVNHVTAQDAQPANMAADVWPAILAFQRTQMRLAAFTAAVHASYREELVKRQIQGEAAVREAVQGYEEGDLEHRMNAGGARALPQHVAEIHVTNAMAEVEIAAVAGRGRGRDRGRGGGRGGATATQPQTKPQATRGAGRGGRGGGGRGGAAAPVSTSGTLATGMLDPRNYGCFICESKQHLQKHCPELTKGKEQMTFAGNNTGYYDNKPDF
jgi:hypothetical protein